MEKLQKSRWLYGKKTLNVKRDKTSDITDAIAIALTHAQRL